MTYRRLNILLSFVLLFLLTILVSTYKTVPFALSATTHVVISEVQVTGDVANDEFVELYNPTDSEVSLSGWRLTRKTAAGTQANLVASFSGTIAPRSFLLVAHPDYDGSVVEDVTYSSTTSAIAANNSVVLYSDAGLTVVDKVGMGTATDVEATSAAVPAAGTSIERKATTSSTEASMGIGGLDELSGNGEDSDNNGNDFILKTVPQAQNSSSAVEPTTSASPTPVASASPSASPEVSPSATPSASPSASPEPTVSPSVSPTPVASVSPSPVASVSPTPTPSASSSPSATPSPSVSPSPTIAPTPTPSASPSPSVSPSATPTPVVSASPSVSPTPVPSALPSVSPTPSVSPVASATPVVSASPSPSVSPTPSATPNGEVIFQGVLFTCRVTYRTISTRFFSVQFPQIRCTPNR